MPLKFGRRRKRIFRDYKVEVDPIVREAFNEILSKEEKHPVYGVKLTKELLEKLTDKYLEIKEIDASTDKLATTSLNS